MNYMLIQLALDRLALDEAKDLVNQLESHVDIIEIGTSFVKDYGVATAMKHLKSSHVKTLLDIKTIDQGEYEFRQAYTFGADIATVMGTASLATIRACQKVAQEYSREYMIDLLEVNEVRLKELSEFTDAYVSVHVSIDTKSDSDAFSQGIDKVLKYLSPKSIFIAGGITLDTLKAIDASKIDGIIVGRYITASHNPVSIIDSIRTYEEDNG